LPLVAEHLMHIHSEVSPRNVRRLAVRLGKASIVQLGRLVESDMGGRPPLPRGLSTQMKQMLQLAESIDVSHSKPERLIQGRHLIELGYVPARWFGEKLDACYEAQLDGRFECELDGIVYLKELLNLYEK